jgi:hypothetical protein
MFISGQSQNGHAPVLPTYDGKAPDISFDVVDGGTWIFGWLLSQYVTIATDILNFDPSSGPLEWNGCVFYQVKVTDGGSAIGVTPPASQPGIQNYPSIAPGSFVIGSGMSIGAEEQTSVDCVPSGGIAQSNGNDSFPATGITRYMIYDVNATAPVNPIPVQFQVTTTGGNLQNYSFILLSSEAL